VAALFLLSYEADILTNIAGDVGELDAPGSHQLLTKAEMTCKGRVGRPLPPWLQVPHLKAMVGGGAQPGLRGMWVTHVCSKEAARLWGPEDSSGRSPCM